jgi:hypothetical protein
MVGNCLIKGNISKNGDRIYHVPDSPSYDRTIIDDSKPNDGSAPSSKPLQPDCGHPAKDLGTLKNSAA